MNMTTLQEASNSAITALLNRRINHPRVGEVIAEVDALAGLGAENIIMVVGPTGVGKSTLAVAIENRILKTHRQEMQANAGLIPVLRIEARATSESDFNWKLFYLDVLEALEGEVSTPAVAYGVNPMTNMVIKPHGPTRNTAPALRKKVEQALKARGVKFLIIDEGGHFTNVSETKMKRQTDALKSLSNCAGCQIILLGSYDILDVSRLSAQLARRVKEIHFSRYRIDSIDDCIEFKSLLQYLENEADGYFKGLLTENAELLQNNTLGCIGTLMNLIRGFVSRAERYDGVSQALLEKSLQTPGQCTAILAEIRMGEDRFDADKYVQPKQRGAA